MFRNSTAIILATTLMAAPLSISAQEAEDATEEQQMEQTDDTAQTGEEAATVEGDDVSSDTEMTEEPAEGAAGSSQEMAEDAQTAEENAQPVEGQIVMQGENSMLAGDMMGATVFSADGESVGDIADLIITMDGTVEGVVIGVGGFLGIGQKSVAIEMSQLQVMENEDGTPRLTTDATREDLEAAPEFVTAQEQRQQQEMQESADAMQEGGGNATGSDAGQMDGTATEGAMEPAEGEMEAEESSTAN
ncbi:PRC-barrel domain-containing protein [Palleronia abyssalis]|uniref:PRC-barrel domain-containing protein n=1 Tax=Palleronia abyssalis TaxID=1501240 RepID=A0A2R8BY78_9RHOB|nr:PRC-barrel domain-containing protein [Palleronia abyssalis]SPJ25137.1 hypothetical protein PAA8504_02983 [Palleronia abyssalis]